MGHDESIEIVDVTPVPAAELDTVDFRGHHPRGARIVALTATALVPVLVLVAVTHRGHSAPATSPSVASPVSAAAGPGPVQTEPAFVTGQETCSTVGTSLRQMTLTARVRNHLHHRVTVRSVSLRFQQGVFVRSIRVGVSRSATGCPTAHELKAPSGYRAAPGNLWLAVDAVVAQPCGVPIIGDWTVTYVDQGHLRHDSVSVGSMMVDCWN